MPIIETCHCGEQHHPGANYYVTAEDAGRHVALAGAFATHAEAVAALPKVKAEAWRVDNRAAFYAYGTVAMTTDYTTPGQLNYCL